MGWSGSVPVRKITPRGTSLLKRKTRRDRAVATLQGWEDVMHVSHEAIDEIQRNTGRPPWSVTRSVPSRSGSPSRRFPTISLRGSTKQGHAPFAWSVLGAGAQATRQIELMTAVTCPNIRYHPVTLAQGA